jgi:outer membrane protein
MKVAIFAILLALLVPLSLAAQKPGPGGPLTVEAAVALALETEPSIAIAEAERDAANAARRNARSIIGPQVTLSGSAVRHDEPMLVSPIHGFTPGLIPEFDETLIQSALSGSLLLWDGGVARARVRQAEAVIGSADEGLAVARQALVARTSSVFFAVLAAADTVAAEDLRLQSIESELRRIEILRTVGRAADLEIFRAEAARASATADRTAAVAELEVAEAELARLTALPPETTRAAHLSRPPLPPAADQGGVAENPRVRAARRLVAAQQAALEAARASRKPQVNLAGSLLEYGSGSGDFVFEWNAGVNLRFPVIDSGAARARVEAAMAGLHLAEAQLALAEREIRRSLDRALAEERHALAAIESFEHSERRFAEVARIERLRLDAGAGTQTDYLRAESDLASSRAALARARLRLAMARVELARLSGVLDSNWIAANLRSEQ